MSMSLFVSSEATITLYTYNRQAQEFGTKKTVKLDVPVY